MRLVIPAVDYADHLAVVLPGWRAALPGAATTIVTAPHDADTQALAARHGVRCVVTDVWYGPGRIFDKAAALDVAFGLSPDAPGPPPNKGERCIAADADVYPFGKLPRERLSPRAIYGCPRYLCPTQAALEAHLRGKTRRSSLALMLSRYRGMDGPPCVPGASHEVTLKAARACLGYFQLWRYYPGQAFGSYRTGGKYDLDFRDSFAARYALEHFYLLHLGNPHRANWRGRVQPRWAGPPAATVAAAPQDV